jgi:hypothetical protein
MTDHIKPGDRIQIWDGRPYVIEDGKPFNWSCCHCGLVHVERFYPEVPGNIVCITYEHERMTAVERKAGLCSLMDGTDSKHVLITRKEYKHLKSILGIHNG